MIVPKADELSIEVKVPSQDIDRLPHGLLLLFQVHAENMTKALREE
jgi:hypothetical protein